MQAGSHLGGPIGEERESLTKMLNEWKKGVEGQWSSVQEEWNQERERLSKAREEWESKTKSIEQGLGTTISKVESGLANMAAFQNQHRFLNGEVKHNGGGLVTPPSPRSLSSDSNRPRHRRKRSASSRGRSRSFSQEPVRRDSTASDELTDGSGMSVSFPSLRSPSKRTRSYPYIPSMPDDDSDSDADRKPLSKSPSSRFPITPESSIRHSSTSTTASEPSPIISPSKVSQAVSDLSDAQVRNLQTAVGILVLSVAAAAVAWRVKPE